MSGLLELIKEYAEPEALAGDWEQVALLVGVQQKLVVDPQPWTYAKIGEVLGEEAQTAASDLLRGLADQNGQLMDAHQLLLLGDGVKTGLRLDLPKRQQSLDQLIDAVPDEAKPLLESIKKLGYRMESILPQMPTGAECQQVWEDEVDRERLEARRTKLEGLQEEFDVIKNQIDTAEHQQAVDALRAMANTLEA